MVENKTERPKLLPFKFEPYNPGPDYSDYLRVFNKNRNLELQNRLTDRDNYFTGEGESLEVCGEVESHGGKVPPVEEIEIFDYECIGVFSSKKMATVRVSYGTKPYPGSGNGERELYMHGGTYVARLCPDHISSIPRRGILEINRLEKDEPIEIGSKVFPGKIYRAFGLPESPFQK